MLRAVVLAVIFLASPGLANPAEDQALALANAARAQAGCGPLKMNNKLQAAAAGHAQAMAKQNFFSHAGKDGSKFSQRIKAKGYRYKVSAENIAAGYGSAVTTMEQWMNSPVHRKNLLDCRFKETGIAVTYQADDEPFDGSGDAYQYYWVQEFAAK